MTLHFRSAQTSGWCIIMIMCGLCTCAWFPPPTHSGLQWHSATQSQSLPPLPAESVKQILPFGNSTLLLKMVTFNAKTHYKWPLLIAMLNHQRVHGDVWQLEVLIRRNLLDFDVPSLSCHVEYPKSGEVTLIFTTFYKVHL